MNEKNEIMSPETVKEIARMNSDCMAQAMNQVLAPMMQGLNQMGQMMVQMQQTMTAMHKDMMRQMALSSSQQRYVNAAMRERVDSVMEEYSLDEEAKKVLNRSIRKRLYQAFGVRAVREIPAADYNVALDVICCWDESQDVKKLL